MIEPNKNYKGFYQITFICVIGLPCKNNMGSVVPTTNGDWLEEQVIFVKQMKRVGYVPDMNFVSHDME